MLDIDYNVLCTVLPFSNTNMGRDIQEKYNSILRMRTKFHSNISVFNTNIVIQTLTNAEHLKAKISLCYINTQTSKTVHKSQHLNEINMSKQ